MRTIKHEALDSVVIPPNSDEVFRGMVRDKKGKLPVRVRAVQRDVILSRRHKVFSGGAINDLK
ncbi:hypothetical protein ACFW6E_37600 [Streptomyces olivaceoviridis]|uniref:hypothetical protein n=1 Tax=Streptomyces olivaceoviridis TaxID=1921 RepID=UPI003679182A